MKKLLSKLLTILLCLNLLATSFYPFLTFPTVVKAQEESNDGSWDIGWSSVPAAETAPAEAPQEQVDSCLMYGEGCQYTVPGYEAPPIAQPLPTATPEPTPEPTPNCGEPQSLGYNECTEECRVSHEVFQDSCGRYSFGRGQYDPGCTNNCPAEVPISAPEPAPSPAPEPSPLCIPDCSGAWVHCSGEVYSDGCGGSCTGTFAGSCDSPAALSVCTSETYVGTCGRECPGLNDCTPVVPPPAPPETPLPTPEPSPEILYTPVPSSIPEPSSSPYIVQQGDSCLQSGACGSSAFPPFYDAPSQQQATENYWENYDRTYATTTNNQYIAAEVRKEDAGGGVMQDIVTTPEVAAETSGNWWDGVTSTVGNAVENMGQAIADRLPHGTSNAQNLSETAATTEKAIEETDKENKNALNKNINSPAAQKMAALRKQFNFPDSVSDEDMQADLALRGIKLDLTNGSTNVESASNSDYTSSSFSIEFSKAKKPGVTDTQVKGCLELGEGCGTGLYWTPEELAEAQKKGQDATTLFALDTAFFGIPGMREKAQQNADLGAQMQPLFLESGLGQALIDERNLNDPGYQAQKRADPSALPVHYTYDGTRNIVFTSEEIEQYLDKHPEFLADPAKNAAAAKLLQMAREGEGRTTEIMVEAAAITAMTLAGGEATQLVKVGGKWVIKKTGQVVKDAAGKIVGEAGEAVGEKVGASLGDLAGRKVAGDAAEGRVPTIFVGAAQKDEDLIIQLTPQWGETTVKEQLAMARRYSSTHGDKIITKLEPYLPKETKSAIAAPGLSVQEKADIIQSQLKNFSEDDLRAIARGHFEEPILNEAEYHPQEYFDLKLPPRQADVQQSLKGVDGLEAVSSTLFGDGQEMTSVKLGGDWFVARVKTTDLPVQEVEENLRSLPASIPRTKVISSGEGSGKVVLLSQKIEEGIGVDVSEEEMIQLARELGDKGIVPDLHFGNVFKDTNGKIWYVDQDVLEEALIGKTTPSPAIKQRVEEEIAKFRALNKEVKLSASTKKNATQQVEAVQPPPAAEALGIGEEKLVRDYFPAAEQLIKEQLGREGSEEEVQHLAIQIWDATTETKQGVALVDKNIERAKKYVDFRKTRGESGMTIEEERDIWNRLRIEGAFSQEEFNLLSQEPEAMTLKIAEILSDAEIKAQKANLSVVVPRVNRQMRELDDYLAQNHPKKLKPRGFQMEENDFHIVSSDGMKKLNNGREDVGGLAMDGKQVALREDSADGSIRSIGILSHETCHECATVSFGNWERQYSFLYKGFSEDNALKLNESLTEFYTNFFSENKAIRDLYRSDTGVKYSLVNGELRSVVPTNNPNELMVFEEGGKKVIAIETGGFQAQAAAIHDELVPAIIENLHVSREQANAIVLGAARDSRYFELIEAVGGQDKLTAILDAMSSTHPNVSTDVSHVVQIGRAITPTDISQARSNAIAAAAGGIAAVGTGGGLYLNEQSVPTPEPDLLPFKIVSPVHAQENEASGAPVVDMETFELLVKKELIKNALLEDGKVSSEYVKDVLHMDIVEPEIQKNISGYSLTTGKAGTVEGLVEKTIYKVAVNPLPEVDIQIPVTIDLTKDSSGILPIKIKKGSGKVKQVTARSGRGLIGTVYADEVKDATASAKIKVVLIGEKDQVLPWAGVKVNLEKVNQEKTINLIAGWNLVSPTVLPGKPLTASVMLDIINAEGGSASAVSTLQDGAWKTFVSRGSKDYSTDDFLIEPGKAYFVKALKPSRFTYSGQNLVAPIKLKLSSGWNAVGMPVLSKQYKAADLDVDTAARWYSGLWDTFVKKNQQQYGENFSILPGAGYILKVGKETQFSP